MPSQLAIGPEDQHKAADVPSPINESLVHTIRVTSAQRPPLAAGSPETGIREDPFCLKASIRSPKGEKHLLPSGPPIRQEAKAVRVDLSGLRLPQLRRSAPQQECQPQDKSVDVTMRPTLAGNLAPSRSRSRPVLHHGVEGGKGGQG